MVPSKGREITHLAGHQPRSVISTTQQGGKSTNGGASAINGAGNQLQGGTSTKRQENSQNCSGVSTFI